MKAFLRQVADHYLEEGTLENKLFLLPNRRSMLFFQKYIAAARWEKGIRTPMVSPKILAANDFFLRLSGKSVVDRISLVLRLYDCYKQVNPKAESLDEFIYFGDAILADFDDVDKYLVDARSLFVNISDLKSIRDDFSYLNPTQISAIEKLIQHFDGNWRRNGSEAGKDMKEQFFHLWQMLLPLYNTFRDSLSEDGLAYEGMALRDLCDRLDNQRALDIFRKVEPDAQGCVLVGLNVLSGCEKKILRRMQAEGLMEFCWDCSSPMIMDAGNPASRFLRENVRLFPNSFNLDEGQVGHPRINVISVPSSTGQTKLISDFVSSVPGKERGTDFAIVLPDESMLMPVMGCIPQSVGTINVTMGYPLLSSEWTSLMRSVMDLQMHIKSGTSYFYYKPVYDIFSNSVLRGVLTEDERTCVEKVLRSSKSYIPADDLRSGELFGNLFCPVLTSLTSVDTGQNSALADYLRSVTASVASRLTPENDALTLECAMHYDKCVHRLESLSLAITPRTWNNILEQLLAMVSVPFAGEPLSGLQVLGPLETRSLDFRHLVILNCNEGVFPSGNSKSSFIPSELRLAFGLPTFETQDSVWAYCFYRMISRAENVWMLYDSRTEGLSSGEESRFVKQLRYLYQNNCSFSEYVASGKLSETSIEDVIPKTTEDMEEISKCRLSASSFHRYIECPASFYYYVVRHLKEEADVNENLDAGMLGTVCHDTLQALYCGEEAMAYRGDFDKTGKRRFKALETVSREYIQSWIKRKDEIREKIYSLIMHKLHSPVVEGRNLVSAEIALAFVLAVLKEDLKQLDARKTDFFRILGLEEEYVHTIDGQKFVGYVDRIDSFASGLVRVVDYKTGSDRQMVLDNTTNPETTVGKVFGSSSARDYKAALQFFLYDQMVLFGKSKENGLTVPRGTKIENAMYSMSEIFTKGVRNYPEAEGLREAMIDRISEVLDEIRDPDVGFARVNDPKKCQWCDFVVLCGRKSAEK